MASKLLSFASLASFLALACSAAEPTDDKAETTAVFSDVTVEVLPPAPKKN